MGPILPVIGFAVLGVAMVRIARRGMERIALKLDERERSGKITPDKGAPILRRDPASGHWRPDPQAFPGEVGAGSPPGNASG